MHDPAAAPHVDRHIPFKKGGWGVAAFIVVLAIALASTAFYIHKTTFREPTDVKFRAAGTASEH